jgi:2',3'-cyclic-nucleotide 2'-phosphodiesterase (5'-nucleotidase family)
VNSSDDEFVQAMKPWKEVVDAEAKKVIGSTNVFLDSTNSVCRKGECNIGNFITNAFVDEVIELHCQMLVHALHYLYLTLKSKCTDDR